MRGADTMTSGQGQVQIGGAIFDPDAGTLRRNGVIVPLRRKAFQLLSFLVGRPDQVVPKNDLMDALWPNVAVTEDSLSQAVRDVRSALGDDAGDVIRTVKGRGYLLAGAATEPGASVTERPRFPRVAIRPFATELVGKSAVPMIDMLADEIAAGLARFRTIQVLSDLSLARPKRPATASAPDPGVPNVDYLIDGAALPSGDGVALRVRLIDTASGALVASELFDCSGTQFLNAQSIVVQRIVGYLQAGIESQPRLGAAARAIEDLSALDHLARGLWASHSDSPNAAEEAEAHYRRAVKADPDLALGWTNLAAAIVAVHDFGGAPREVLDTALAYALKGVALAPHESRTHSVVGYLRCFRGEYAAAEESATRANALNPASSDAITDMVVVHLTRGRPVEAMEWVDRLSEVQPFASIHEHTLRGEALYMLRRYGEAADEFLRVWALSNRRRAFLAAMLAQAGRNAEAVDQLQALSESDPGFDHVQSLLNGYKYENKDDRDHLLQGIQKALSLL